MFFDYKRKLCNLIFKDVSINYDSETVVYKDTLYFDTTYYEVIKEFECYKNFVIQYKRKSTDKDKCCIRTLEDAKYVYMKAFNSYNNKI